MAQTVSVGCKLPHGLYLDVGDARVALLGTNSSLVIGGYGITENVDKEFFETWMAAHQDSAAVKNGFIFANDKISAVKAQASEMKDERNGFEGLDPAKPAPGIESDMTV